MEMLEAHTYFGAMQMPHAVEKLVTVGVSLGDDTVHFGDLRVAPPEVECTGTVSWDGYLATMNLLLPHYVNKIEVSHRNNSSKKIHMPMFQVVHVSSMPLDARVGFSRNPSARRPQQDIVWLTERPDIALIVMASIASKVGAALKA